MKTLRLAGLVFGVTSIVASAQPICPPVIRWQKSFGTPNSESGWSVQQTVDGGFVIGGVSPYFGIPGGNITSPNYGQRDYWLIRTDSDGNKLWDRSYGGNGDDLFNVVERTADGGFILGGESWYESTGGNKTSTNYGLSDIWIVRTDAGGNKLWDRSYGSSNFESLGAIQPTTDGGFVLAGLTAEVFWVVRIDGDGNRIWDRAYNGGYNASINAIRQTEDGGFIIGGSAPGGSGELDYRVIRIDASGNPLWSRFYGGSRREQMHGLALTPDGGCLIGGWSESQPGGTKTSRLYGGTDFWVVRLNAQGNKVWERSYGGADNDLLESVSGTADGGFLLAGFSISPPGWTKTAPQIGYFDYWIIRTDANGNEIWQGTFGGSNSEFCRAASQASDGGYILAGVSASVDGDRHGRSFGSDDIWVVKLAPENPDDCDYDGVPNAQDQCPGTALGALVNAQGCSIEQLCPCDMDSHDAYVACVRETAKAFQQAGLINNAHRHQLIETARASRCPTSSTEGEGFIFGLPHRRIEPAELMFRPDWFAGLLVYAYTEDSYGVSIALGEADSGLFIYPDGNQSNYGEEWFFDVTAYGRHSGANNDDIVSSIRVRKPYYESYPVSVNLDPMDPESVTVQIFSNRIVVAERTFSGSSANFHISGYASLDPRGNPYWRMPDGSVGAIVEFTHPFALQRTDYYEISFGNEDDGFDGDQIFVRANNPRHGVQFISRVDAVGGGGVPGFEIHNERLGMFGHPNQALGAVSFNALRGQLQVNTLESIGPEDFAAVLVEAPRGAARLEIDLDSVRLENTGAALALYPAGVIDGDPIAFGQARISRGSNDMDFRCDFQVLFDLSSNSPSLRVEALKNGRVTGSAIVSGAVLSGGLTIAQGHVPEITGCRTTINSNGIPTLGISFARVTTLTGIEGGELSGNHIRVTPIDPRQSVRSISMTTIEMLEHPSITITGERSTVVPPVLSVQPAAGELVLSWQDSTRLYSLESASSLTGPFAPVLDEVETIDRENRLTVPISNEGTRFFRLSGPPD